MRPAVPDAGAELTHLLVAAEERHRSALRTKPDSHHRAVYGIVRTTLPRFRQDSTYRWASAAWSIG
jgi:hypothetical protein